MTTKIELIKRRQTVLKLKSMGFSLREIAEQQKLSLKTVQRYYEVMRDEVAKEIDTDFISKVKVEMITEIENVKSELWKIYAKTERENSKIRILEVFAN